MTVYDLRYTATLYVSRRLIGRHMTDYPSSFNTTRKIHEIVVSNISI